MWYSSANWEMDLTQAEVVRDQKHISRTGYFNSVEHFSGILLPAGQEALFIILRDADTHHCIQLWYTEINGEFPTGRYGTLENMQSWFLISNSQFFFYLAQLSQLCLGWVPQPLNPSKEDRRDETSAVNIEDAMLFGLTSVTVDAGAKEPRLTIFRGLSLGYCTQRLYQPLNSLSSSQQCM